MMLMFSSESTRPNWVIRSPPIASLTLTQKMLCLSPPPPYPQAEAQVQNWRKYDASLRQRGSLTVWFSAAATEGWRAEPRIPGGQPWYSPLAILTALTLRAVLRLALRQTEGLIGSILLYQSP
jgi:hypothetical protein